MIVDPNDGRCRSCDGVLEILDGSDATLVVTCTECADSYDVEPDAFNDGCMTYYPAIMAKKMEEGDDEEI